MMPNIDPKMLKSMMAKMGIKSTEIDAITVVIHCPDKDIVIGSPQVTQIEMNGATSFQVAGSVTEREKQQEQPIDVSDDDVRLVMEKTGASEDAARKAITDAKGDIAAAIMDLGG